MHTVTWSRRAVLTAASAAAVEAVAVAGCGLAGSSGPRRSSGRLSTSRWAEADGQRPRWLLATPRTGTPTGLVVALHGHGGTAQASFEGGLDLQDHVEATGLAVVAVDGGDGYWHARRDGSDSGAMVTDDLVPMALRTVGLPASTPVALLGWSMGGFGALWLATRLGRARVRAVVAESAAVWLTPGETPAGAFDDREDFERVTVFNHLPALSALPVRLDCGTSDPFLAANRRLAAALPRAKATFDDGGHTTSYWRSHAAAQLAWVRQQGR